MELYRSLYRLKDAATVWNKLLFNVLKQHCLTEKGTALSLFDKQDD